MAEFPTDEVRTWVRSAMYEKNELLNMFLEELHAPGELDRAETEKAIDSEIQKLKVEQKTWPKVTDNDKLDRAFENLNNFGIIALQNTGNTQSDGLEDVSEVYDSADDKSKIIGYCFYHGQDLERAVKGKGLHLTFGSIDSTKEKDRGPIIGKKIAELLEQEGLQVEWEGTSAKRIFIRKFDWKKRIN